MSPKDKNETKQKLIDAVGTILVRDGFSKIGINSIAKEASVSKVLIYRYFDNLDSLVQAFILQKDYWLKTTQSNPLDQIKSKSDLLDWTHIQFSQYLDHLVSNPELQEIHRWELIEGNPITETIAKQRGQFGRDTSSSAASLMEQTAEEIDAISSIVTGGLLYLVLRSKTIDRFNSLDFKDEKTWARLEHAVDQIFTALIK